jgi:hypothetical protein
MAGLDPAGITRSLAQASDPARWQEACVSFLTRACSLFKWIIIHLNNSLEQLNTKWKKKKTKCIQWKNKFNVKRMYEAYLVTETNKDDGDETSVQDRWWLVLETMKTMMVLTSSAIRVLCFAVRFSFVYVPLLLFLSPYSAFLCVSFCAIYSPSSSLPYIFSLLIFFSFFFLPPRFSFSFFSLSFYFFSPLFPPSLFFLPLLCLVSPVSLFFHFFFLSLFRSVEEVYI